MTLFKLPFETYVHCQSLEEAVTLGNKLTEKNSCGEILIGVMEIRDDVE